MTTTPDPGHEVSTAGGAEAADHRLHPMSWLFVLLQQLRQFVLPLVAAFFFGGDRNELWPLIGVGVLALVSVWRYYTYRYGFSGDALVVRSGVLERSVRVIPFARIHNVALQQSVLHRLFGVAEVRLESAGGQKPEAEMRVLKLADALALEALVRRRPAPDPAVAAPAAEARVLLALPPREILRLGLISNRGLIVVGAAIGGLSQFNPRLVPDLMERWGEWALGWASHNGTQDPAFLAVAGLSLALLVVALLRLFSIVLALLQHYGFTLTETGRRLTVERGLLARWRTSASRRRIQAWTLRETLLHRLLQRRSLDIDTAVAEQHNQQRTLRELVPVATPAACDALIEHLLPRAAWLQLDWRALPRRAWWRLVLPGLPVALVLTAAAAWFVGPWALLALLWLPWAAYVARRHMRAAAYAVNADVIAVREGWWSRHWRFAELDKLQALQLTRNPLDRRCGTATLWLDTAGASALAPPLRIRFLPEAEAAALYAQLARTLARRPLRW
ncbi:PH domain-containing protein [Lysobacter yangpyeongensis]|uniref:PH domain-containing protein n=1 Tax=Lysobacter yangpyeongensis TaxID=346182 RepID=A0ABW0SMS1_9GAMM